MSEPVTLRRLYKAIQDSGAARPRPTEDQVKRDFGLWLNYILEGPYHLQITEAQ